MRNIITITLLINLFLSLQMISAQSYPTPDVSRERKLYIIIDFETYWEYFRMKRNPLLSYKETHDGENWKIPFLIPKKFNTGHYMADIKISKWGKSKKNDPNEYVDFHDCCGFYLVEKEDGLTGIKRALMTDSILDTMHLNIYDSIFPFDNRFLVKYLYTDKDIQREIFSFHSGNIEWGEWKDVEFRKDVAYCGYIRGVQFGIENVVKFRQDFSDKIRSFRPDFPKYVYTESRYTSLLTNGFLIIGAPEGKEDQLIEYIYYSNLPEKTGDLDETHYYEMRYILPTQIKSIKERRLEKRRLTDEEQKYILDRSNEMLLFLDNKEDFFVRVRKAATAIIEDVEEIEE